MSTKTNFKRIALVAVAALGLGVLSSVPSQALVTGLTVNVTNGTAKTNVSDTSTAAKVEVSFLGAATTDSVSLSVVPKSVPAGAVVAAKLVYTDTATTIANTSTLDSVYAYASATSVKNVDSITSISTGGSFRIRQHTSPVANSYLGGTFQLWLDTTTVASSALVVGTYTYTLIVTSYDAGIANATITTKDVSIVISTPSATSSAGTSTAYLNGVSGQLADSTTLTSVATSSDTVRAYIMVTLKDADGVVTNAAESVTITTNVGTVGTSTNRGRSVKAIYNAGATNVYSVWSDGTAGTATISISTPTITFPAKTMVFYASAPTTLTASVINSTLGVGSTTAIAVSAKDANGNAYAGTLYTYSDTAAVVSNDGTNTCSYNSATSRHECSIVGVSAGTAKITVRDASTVALSTVSSTAVSVTVSTAAAATVKLSFDKASYAPNEKAILTVTVLDSAGKVVPANSWSNLFATGGITSTAGFGANSADVTGVLIATASPALTLASAVTDPVKTYTMYMPAAGGTITVSATGGSSLPVAGQVKVSATATITDSGAAALAAVTALATTVASLKTLITTLTNLVLKIQKKVKA